MDARSDIYSLGCVIYEMLGRAAVDGHAGLLARKGGARTPLRVVRHGPWPCRCGDCKAWPGPGRSLRTAAQFGDALRALAPSAVYGRPTVSALRRSIAFPDAGRGCSRRGRPAALKPQFSSNPEASPLEYTPLTSFRVRHVTRHLARRQYLASFLERARSSVRADLREGCLRRTGAAHERRCFKMAPKFSADGFASYTT